MELTEEQKKMIRGEICPYCGLPSQYVDSEIIYGESYGMVYLCAPCGAYCGVHKGTNISLGRLANKELRTWKRAAHRSFDPIWKEGHRGRRESYELLSKYLGIPDEYCHIGMFSVKTCKRVIEWADEFLKKVRK